MISIWMEGMPAIPNHPGGMGQAQYGVVDYDHPDRPQHRRPPLVEGDEDQDGQ
jgi:hypothetical protein